MFSTRLEEEEFYYLELLYFENAGSSHINLRWLIDGKMGYYATIPQSQLYTELPSDPDGIINVDRESAYLFAAPKSLCILDAKSQPVDIYTLAGECVKSEVMSGNRTIPLSPGVYVVRLGDKAKKIAIR